MRRFILLIPCLLALAALPAPAADNKGEARVLFNGKDFTGWETWLRKVKKDDPDPVVNNDPTKVFSVVTVDGQPAIRVSGEFFGAITSKDEFENYHLRLEFKWGEKKWPPRENAVRDSGLLYHCVGPHGLGTGGPWMQSLECQIQEKDCGDYWPVGPAVVDVTAVKNDKNVPVYKKSADKLTAVKGRIIKDADYEKPTGQWNTIELFTVGDTSVHVVNGKANMILTNGKGKLDGKDIALTKGKIQLQSEGAEVYYRNLTLRPIKAIPPEYLK